MGSSIGDNTWRCMVCGATDRPFDAISVAYVPCRIEPANTWNVSYCNDRPACTTTALAATSWPLVAV